MDNKKTNTDFLDNGYSIPYPEDPFEMNSGPFYVGKGNNGETIVSKNLENVRALTVSLTANFLKPAEEGTLLKAFPKINHRTKRTAFMEAHILADEKKVLACTSVIRLISSA